MNIRPIIYDLTAPEPSSVFWRAQTAVWLLLAIVGFCCRLIIFGNAVIAFWLTLALEPLAFLMTSAAAIAHGRYAKNASFISAFIGAAILCFLASALLPAIGYLIHDMFPSDMLSGLSQAQYRLGFFYYMGIFWIWTLIYFGVASENGK